jgi:hypothetical protein
VGFGYFDSHPSLLGDSQSPVITLNHIHESVKYYFKVFSVTLKELTPPADTELLTLGFWKLHERVNLGVEAPSSTFLGVAIFLEWPRTNAMGDLERYPFPFV